MSLTPEQQASAAAWEAVFSDSASNAHVMDDMLAYARGLTDPLCRAGALDLYGYMQSKRTQFRRAARAASPKGRSKT